jgi:hypothetical protein
LPLAWSPELVEAPQESGHAGAAARWCGGTLVRRILASTHSE